MSQYRRLYQKGGIVFLTIVTYNRKSIFNNPRNIDLLRKATATVKSEIPFDILGAVILPDHFHFLWQLPPDNVDYSKRVGRLKALFTKSLKKGNNLLQEIPESRKKHRESNIWQRRFWEHTIRDERDFEQHLDYIHYNPVKHGLVSCPHLWEYSSFNLWVKKGFYDQDWACFCKGKKVKIPDFREIVNSVGE